MSLAHKLAWCAGFFDGEGFITIQRRKTKANGKIYEGHYLRIGVNHVAVKPLEELQKILGGTIRQQTGEVVGNRHRRHSWQMSTTDAANALKKMMPYFLNKNRVAELALDFQNTMCTNKRAGVSEEVFALRESLKQQISTENAKD